ncbi:AAA domain-containing protein [Amylostereum chailletii]|nr:AAA domain-containing protein [Amylostereum chailletii]
MSASSSRHDPQRMREILVKLRDEPVDSEDCTETTLETIYKFVMNIPPSSDGVHHWFCTQADDTSIMATTFLLRLFAYDADRVNAWKGRLKSCLGGCCGCVRGLQVAKWVSKESYLAAFSKDMIEMFIAAFDDWEVNLVLETLSAVGITADRSSTEPPVTLYDAAVAATYHIVSNLSVLRNARIQAILIRYSPPSAIQGWPADIPPPGLFYLLFHEDSSVRQWAQSHMALYKTAPLSREAFMGPYATAFEAISQIVGSTHAGASSSNFGSLANGTASQPSILWTADPVVIWSSLGVAMRFFPLEFLLAGASTTVDLGRVVAGRLHDKGPHFSEILRCLVLLLKRLGPALWAGQGADYPQVVFDAIRDNDSYPDLLETIDSAKSTPWYLLWFTEYIQSIWSCPAFENVLAKMVDFLCEEMQHDRFGDARPTIMVAAAGLLTKTSQLIRFVFNKALEKDASAQKRAVLNVMDIHVDRLIDVAFIRPHTDSKWTTARSAVQRVISLALETDVQDITNALSQLSVVFTGRVSVVSVPNTRRLTWKKMFENVRADDVQAVALIVSLEGLCAHADVLRLSAFSAVFEKAGSNGKVKETFDEVNSSLRTFREGFSETVAKFTTHNPSSTVEKLLRSSSMINPSVPIINAVVPLMLSPVRGIQTAAQTLVCEAFDVDVFIPYASSAPEACNTSKSLVKCLTDVIEVLCGHPDGLLYDDSFLHGADGYNPGSELLHLWSIMAKAISIIFKRTPSWSNFLEPEDMVHWMRDALIFAREMLAQWKVFETAAMSSVSASNPNISSSKRKLSRAGRKMIDDLQTVLLELSRWLRLTDEELLHQSFSLLQSLLDTFRETGIPPNEPTRLKLKRHIDDARNQDPTKSRPQSKLDATRLAKLEDALASFEDSDNDIEILDHKVPEQLPTAKKGERVARAELKAREPTKSSVKLTRQPSPKIAETSQPSYKKKAVPPLNSQYFSARDQQKLNSKNAMAPRPKPLQPVASSSRSSGEVSNRYIKADASRRSEADDSSASDESSEEDGAGLAGLSKMQRMRSPKKPPLERRTMLMELPTSMKNPIQARVERRDDARRVAMRMKPDISGLHRIVLSWPYDDDGPHPPGKPLQLTRVPDQFANPAHYRRVFEPLLLLECWAQLGQSKEIAQDTFDCKITSRQFLDDWVDVDIHIEESLTAEWYLTETDVVILRQSINNKSILAKVQSYKLVPFGPQRGVQASLRCYLDKRPDPGLQPNSVWKISKVFSLSTLHREYAALVAMEFYDFSDFILKPKLKPTPLIPEDELRATMQAYNVNEPQARAIESALQTEGFSLIQGPPGTGKTSTICGLVHTFMVRRARPTTIIHPGRNAGPTDKTPMKKVLICAPSNAAIDEVANRLKGGVSGAGQRTPPSVVRLGVERSLNLSVRDISLDSLVDQKLSSSGETKGRTTGAPGETTNLRAELEKVKESKRQKEAELYEIRDNISKSQALEDEIKKLNRRRIDLTQQLDRLRDQQKSEHRTMDAIRRKYRQEVLSEADVICTTLSGAGHDILELLDFDMIIIDEAAQAIELSTLIPLKYRCSRCVMVGDPQQLPPTVISQEASKYLYNQSLFVRFQKHRPDAVHLLSIQYRMHPDISALPSQLFYAGRLQDGPGMVEKTAQPWHNSSRFGRYRFFNVHDGLESSGSAHSLTNATEARVAVALYARLVNEFSMIDFAFRVGIVTMYRAQLGALKTAFKARFGADIIGKVDFNTVDGFQGQEKDVIILSCVRAGPGVQSVGFLSDVRRMNVALTRAKSSLFILGHAPTLERSDENWKTIVSDARSRACLVDTTVAYFTSQGAAPALRQSPVSPYQGTTNFSICSKAVLEKDRP